MFLRQTFFFFFKKDKMRLNKKEEIKMETGYQDGFKYPIEGPRENLKEG